MTFHSGLNLYIILAALFSFWDLGCLHAQNTIAFGTCGVNLTWVLTDDSTLTISSGGAMNDYDMTFNCSPWHSYRIAIKNRSLTKNCTFAHMQNYSSKLLENAVNQIARLPGIGKRTAVRLALYFLKQSKEDVSAFTSAILAMRNEVFYCKSCHNISDSEQCEICRDLKRNKSLICVVQDIRDVVAIENTSAYNGVYHVLGGVISPMNGIGIAELNLQSLFERIMQKTIEEIILALPATTEGDTTGYYIYKHIQSSGYPINVTVIARGLSVGDELEYADETTLSRSLLNRTDFETSIMKK